MAFPNFPPVDGNSMNRVTYFKPTSELGSGYINYTAGQVILVDDIVPTSSGAIDAGSDAKKFNRVWADNAYFGGDYAKLIVDHHVDVNGGPNDDALCVRQSGIDGDGIQIEYAQGQASEAERFNRSAMRIYTAPYYDVSDGPVYDVYGTTALRIDNHNRCMGIVINNTYDGNENIQQDDDKKGILINGTRGSNTACGINVLHNNSKGGFGVDIQMSDVGLLTGAQGGAGFKVERNGTIGSAIGVKLSDNTVFGSTEKLMDIQSRSPSDCVRIQQTANGRCMHVASSGTKEVLYVEKVTGAGNGITVDNGGTGIGVDVNQTGNNQALTVTQDGTATAAVVTQNQDYYAFNVQQNGDQVGINVDKTGTGVGHAIRVDNDGTGYGIFINQDGTSNGLRLNQNANADGAYIRKLGTGTGAALVVDDEGAGTALYVISEGSGGNGLFITHTPNTVVMNVSAANESYSSHMSYLACHRAANSEYSFLTGVSDSNGTPDTEVKLRGDGTILSDKAATTPADYAEYFEALDPAGFGAGLAVQMCEDQANASKVELATDATKVVGFVSAAPAIIGDSAWSRWTGKYLKDKFGAYQLDENGERVLNPEFDPELEYEPRADRPEWQTIGMLGKLWVRSQDTDILPGQRVTLGDDGLVRRALDGDTVSWHVSEVRDYDVTDGYQVVRIIYK